MSDSHTTSVGDTIHLGRIPNKAEERVLHEILIQAGPLKDLKIIDHRGGQFKYAFAQYRDIVSAVYAFYLFNGTLALYGHRLTVSFAHISQQQGNASAPKVLRLIEKAEAIDRALEHPSDVVYLPQLARN